MRKWVKIISLNKLILEFRAVTQDRRSTALPRPFSRRFMADHFDCKTRCNFSIGETSGQWTADNEYQTVDGKWWNSRQRTLDTGHWTLVTGHNCLLIESLESTDGTAVSIPWMAKYTNGSITVEEGTDWWTKIWFSAIVINSMIEYLINLCAAQKCYCLISDFEHMIYLR